MADPVSNQNPVTVTSGKTAQAGKQSEARAPREPERSENSETAAAEETVKLSETGVSLSTSGAGGSAARIESADEALSVAQQVREQLSGNHAMALAAHGSNARAAAATLEKTA